MFHYTVKSSDHAFPDFAMNSIEQIEVGASVKVASFSYYTVCTKVYEATKDPNVVEVTLLLN